VTQRATSSNATLPTSERSLMRGWTLGAASGGALAEGGRAFLAYEIADVQEPAPPPVRVVMLDAGEDEADDPLRAWQGVARPRRPHAVSESADPVGPGANRDGTYGPGSEILGNRAWSKRAQLSWKVTWADISARRRSWMRHLAGRSAATGFELGTPARTRRPSSAPRSSQSAAPAQACRRSERVMPTQPNVTTASLRSPRWAPELVAARGSGVTTLGEERWSQSGTSPTMNEDAAARLGR
jgi:hypothetical protein